MHDKSREAGVTKTVLVTGATGFLGSHVCHALTENGHHVLAYCRSTSDRTRLGDLGHELQWYDTSDGLERPFVEHTSIDALVHLATHYGRGENQLSDQIEANLVLPLRLLELCRKRQVSLFLNTGSFITKGLGNYEYLQGYALSKSQVSQWAKQYASHLEVVDAVLEHVYGDRDSVDKFIPMVISRLLGSERHIDFTSGEQTRDFVYAGDVASALTAIIEASRSGATGYIPVEVGTGQLCSIKDAVVMMERIIRSGKELRFGQLAQREGEIMSSRANNSMFDHYGWRAETSLEQGFQKTISYYTSRLKGATGTMSSS
ncbi:MAG: NAD(P)-dependent oxidoreductase [Pseudomonadota bacterium]